MEGNLRAWLAASSSFGTTRSLRLQPFTTKSEFSPLLTFSIRLRLVVVLLLLLLPVPLPDELQRPPQAERPEDQPGEDVTGQVVHVLSGQIRDLRKYVK